MKNGQFRKFDVVVSNPPYQLTIENPDSEAQATNISIFQNFQMAGLVIANKTAMIYPGGRWLQRGGKGMKKFGDFVLSSPNLTSVTFFPLEDDNYPFERASANVQDGVAITVFNQNKDNEGTFIFNGTQQKLPKEKLLPVDLDFISITNKLDSVKKIKERAAIRTLFGIESNWIDTNRERAYRVSDFPTPPKNLKDPIQLLTNDKGGKAGRPHWYWVERNEIKKNLEQIDKWQFVIGSAQFANQRNQIKNGEIIASGKAFGRSKIALATFDTEEEIKNFAKAMRTVFFTRLYHQSLNGGVSNINYFVPDLIDYTNKNPIFQNDAELQKNYSKDKILYEDNKNIKKITAKDFIGLDLNKRLYKLFNLTEEEIKIIETKSSEF